MNNKYYRFGFNSMEKDDEWSGTGNLYDYGFRIQDARLARFLSVDPLYSKFPMLSTYQYASNNPIRNIDLDGLEGVDFLEATIRKTEGYTIVFDRETKQSVSERVEINNLQTNTKYGNTVTATKTKTTYKIDENGNITSIDKEQTEIHATSLTGRPRFSYDITESPSQQLPINLNEDFADPIISGYTDLVKNRRDKLENRDISMKVLSGKDNYATMFIMLIKIFENLGNAPNVLSSILEPLASIVTIRTKPDDKVEHEKILKKEANDKYFKAIELSK